MNMLKKSQWSPYLAGALIGVVSWFAVLTAGKYLGVSTTFVRTAGMIESLFVPEHVATLPYFVKEKPIGSVDKLYSLIAFSTQVREAIRS